MDPRVVSRRLSILKSLAVEAAKSINGWSARTAQHLGPGQYQFDGPFAPLALPAAFAAGKTVLLKATATVPADWPIEQTYLEFSGEDLEALLSVNGVPYAGLDHHHTRVRLNDAGRLRLEIECHCVPRSFRGPTNQQGRFLGASLVRVNPVIESLYYDLLVAVEAARCCPDARRRETLEEAVESTMLAMDLTAPRQELVAQVRRAALHLRRQLGRIGPDPQAGSVFLTGHSHIDTAWLWPLRETVRKVGRTFATACRLMERYDHFYFACSQPQLYQYAKDHYPALYKQICKWVEAGRWEATGAMWVEADCNVTGGESLIRQILLGMRFFQEEFGRRPRVCWLPDVFGYPASLPEILKGCGLDWFFTCKLHWQARNPFPAHLFIWRGLDGSEVVAHVPRLTNYYNGNPLPEQLRFAWDNYHQKARHGELLFPYGYGDGGGGPTDEMLEAISRERRFPGLPATRCGPAEQYFEDVAAAQPRLPAWDGELYLETHRGTFTTQGAMKRANRRSELLLRDAEIFGCLAAASGVAPKPPRLDEAWRTVLLHQFHDILPGSSIGMVYQEALADHTRVQQEVGGILEGTLSRLAGKADPDGDGLALFNSLSWDRGDPVLAELPDRRGDVSLVDAQGRAVPVQVIGRRGGRMQVVFTPPQVPSMGYAGFRIVKAPVAAVAARNGLKATTRRIASRRYLLELDRDGGISRLYDRLREREMVPVGAVLNDLQLFQDGPENEDAWNIHETATRRRYRFDRKTRIEVVEAGPVRAVVRVRRTYRGSIFEQDIVVYADHPRIDFVTRVDWHCRQTVLKAAFPVRVRATEASFEVQFGAVRRPTHRNTSWDQAKFEVPAHRWMDLSESGYGVSVLNDGKYGCDVEGHVMRLTLLRGTISPDPSADQGRHEFTYSLLPHGGDWAAAHTVQRAYELNAPARCVGVRLREGEPCMRRCLAVDGPAVVEALKSAEDGRGLILRLYEPCGGRGPVTVRLAWTVGVVIQCNHVEQDGPALPLRDGQFRFEILPFQIRSFRLV